MRLVSLLVLLLALSMPASGQWIPAGPTNATPVAFARTSRAVFAADFPARTVHRTTDDGRTWQNASPTVTGAGNTPAITGLAAHEGAVGVTVRSTNSTGTGFYRSANDGATWTRAGTLPTTQSDYDGLVATRSGAFAAVAIEPSTFKRRLITSTDGGATWTLRDSVFVGGTYVIAIGDTLVRTYSQTRRLPSGGFQTDIGIAFTTDLGQTWTFRVQPQSCFLAGCQNTAAASDTRAMAYGDGRLIFSGYVSTDLGATWTARPLIPAQLFRYAIGGGRVLAATGSGNTTGFGLQLDATGNGPWTDVSEAAGVQLRLRRELFWTGRSFLIGLESGGVMRSEDGVTWAPGGRFAAQHASNLISLSTHRGALVGGLETERLTRSYDRGTTWWLDKDRLNPNLDESSGFLSLDSVLLAAGGSGIFRTTDLKTWNRITTTPNNVDGFVLVNGRVLAGATTGLYERPASGTTWTQVLAHNLNQFDAGVSGSRLIVNGGNGSQRSYRISLDGGTTWDAAGTSSGSFQVAATSQGFFTATTVVAIFGGGTFQRSLDNGATWHNLKPALGDSLAPTLLDNRGDTLLAIGSTYLAASLDHGTTWRKVAHTGLPFGFNPGSTVNAPVALTRLGDTLYVAFQGQSVWKRSLADLGLTVAADDAPRPDAPALSVSPNPATGPVAVAVTLARAATARIAVYDVLGREVARLHDGALGAGTHRFVWASDAPSSIYLVRCTVDDASVVRTVVRR